MYKNLSIYSIAEALYAIEPKAIVLTYYNNYVGKITLTNNTYNKRFYTVKPSGDTPSGIALLATALKFPNSLILHFTDGYSNVSTSPKAALARIKQVNPKLKIINVEYPKTTGLYPTENSIAIDNVDKFSDVVKKFYLDSMNA